MSFSFIVHFRFQKRSWGSSVPLRKSSLYRFCNLLLSIIIFLVTFCCTLSGWWPWQLHGASNTLSVVQLMLRLYCGRPKKKRLFKFITTIQNLLNVSIRSVNCDSKTLWLGAGVVLSFVDSNWLDEFSIQCSWLISWVQGSGGGRLWVGVILRWWL